MHILIIRARTIILAAAVLVIIPALMLMPRAVQTFGTGERQLPVYSVARNDNKVALTFDCAWNDDDIASILDTLETYECTAAFFVTGDWAEKYPESLKAIHDAGHIIGNHSYNHADYAKMSAEEIAADIRKADECISNICGEGTLYARAPSGSYNDTVVKTIENDGRICVQWSVDALDYKENASEESILSRLVDTGSGDIILMHNGTKLTAKLLPRILKGLKKSYEFVSLDELIYKDGYTIDHTGKQIPDSR